LLIVAVTALLMTAWLARRPLLTTIGAALVAEDPPAAADLVVVSTAAARADALEAARLYRSGGARTIVVPNWIGDSLDDVIIGLGVPYLRTTDLVVAILTRSGVPRDAIVVLPEPIDGLNAEVAQVVAYVRHASGTLRFVTERTHTRRARWLLRRALPDDTVA